MRDEVESGWPLGGIEAIVGSTKFYERVTEAYSLRKNKNGSALRPGTSSLINDGCVARELCVPAEACRTSG